MDNQVVQFNFTAPTGVIMWNSQYEGRAWLMASDFIQTTKVQWHKRRKKYLDIVF